jgi:AcrR family transcriptional regulator
MTVALRKSRLLKSRPYGGISGEERQAERRGRLIEAAVKVYGEVGYRSATVKAVCAAAELTERYFYESFANSEALLIAAYHQVTETLHAEMAAAGAGAEGDATGRINAVLTLYFTRLQQNPQPARVFLLEMHGISAAVDAVQMEAMKRMSGVLLLRAAGPVIAAPMSLAAIGAMGAVITIARRWVAQGYQQPIGEVIATAAQFCRVALPKSEPNKKIRA